MKRITLAMTIAAATIACAEEKPPAYPSPVVAEQRDLPDTVDAQADPSPKTSQIAIAESIRQTCGISDAEAFFDYDSARVSSTAETLLERLADCFETGPLRGQPMSLVGHADPRGTDEYNMALGDRRATSVKTALVAFGLRSNVITTSSRGELESTGSDSTSWPHDRRVDVTLNE
jgi:peptidoglycan-associated lipoprotein